MGVCPNVNASSVTAEAGETRVRAGFASSKAGGFGDQGAPLIVAVRRGKLGLTVSFADVFATATCYDPVRIVDVAVVRLVAHMRKSQAFACAIRWIAQGQSSASGRSLRRAARRNAQCHHTVSAST